MLRVLCLYCHDFYLIKLSGLAHIWFEPSQVLLVAKAC